MRFFRALLLAAGMLFLPIASFAQVSVSVTFGPPELPVYAQPVCPGDGYIWTPGYWAWDGDDYYWVPGTWVEAPQVGFLWTPGYWGWGGSAFIFHEGYWGPHIGFYGGVVYGFGYDGRGYEGGRWDNGHFFYNRSVTNVNVTVIHNVYEKRVEERQVTRVSYNGGRGGIEERPTREQEQVDHERHLPPQAVQTQHVEAARSNRDLRASVNHGKPPIAATSKPGAFNEHEAVPATEGHYEAPSKGENTTAHTNPAVHAKDLPPTERHTPTPTGNTKVDQKYQKQQTNLSTQQNKDRQKLQQTQDKEHQRMQQQKVNDTRNQQVEQKHQQQTQQLQQKHVQQQQKLEQKQQPAHQAAPHQTAAPKEKQ
jgi:WXXGXW repeat (2 copies)